MSGPIKGNILTPGGWINGSISYGERVTAITGGAADPSANGDDYILPGFIDLHVHGGGGKDIMEGGDAPQVIAAMHAKHGTTSLLATTMTAPPHEITAALKAIGALRASWACTWKARTSTPASSVRSPTMRAPPRWPKCSSWAPMRRCA